jgi:glycosyltransferase involved in cell wall biosynthesis
MTLEIMMPFFGDVEQFKKAVKSVLGQSSPEWRLTILDDQFGSPLPAQFVEEQNDSRIIYKINESNLGISQNFQQCVDLAEFDHVTIMGCDDILLPKYVERMTSLISSQPGASYIQPGVTVINDRGDTVLPLADRVKARLRQRMNPPVLLSGEVITSSLLSGNWTYFPSICWKTAELKKFGFRKEFRIVLDLALQLEILAGGGSMYVDNVPTFAYRRHRASASMWSSGDGSRFLEEAALFAEFSKTAKEMGWKTAARVSRCHFSSRLNACIELPRSLLSGNWRAGWLTLRHIVRP